MAYRLALVEYLNTFPFSEGLRLSGLESKYEIHKVTPAMCAQLFEERKVEISLCPVGALRDMPDFEIAGKYCIGADGKVGTVVLLSQVPIEEITSVKLDDHSRTSNGLLQILAKHYWKKTWRYHFDGEMLAESCVMIGDKVFAYKDMYKYSYDLAETWKEWTSLPMVFAVWIMKPGINKEWIQDIDQAFETGFQIVQNGNGSLESWQRNYLMEYISYPFDDQKKSALQKYLHFMAADNL